MKCKPLLFALLMTACSKGAEADLASIGEARSLTAEWALVNDQASQGKLTDTYTRTMREALRQQLETAASSLTKPDSRYGLEMRSILAEADDAASQRLRAHAGTLKQIEDSLESS